MMYLPIQKYCDQLTREFNTISPERTVLLKKISDYVDSKKRESKPINLIYICTHNSRRSHFGHIWSKAASKYYKISGILSFSGGTEATAFNTNAIQALERVGFHIKPMNVGKNAHYQVIYDDEQKPIDSFSKVYDDQSNPQKEFAAIMTCGEAEENCPFIPGAEWRIATPYDDPKSFDHTPIQDEKYDECCKQIALETLYVFSLIK